MNTSFADFMLTGLAFGKHPENSGGASVLHTCFSKEKGREGLYACSRCVEDLISLSNRMVVIFVLFYLWEENHIVTCRCSIDTATSTRSGCLLR